MKRWLACLLIAWATNVAAGPGGSGGTPGVTISGLQKGYVFRSPYPTAVRVGQADVYEYQLLGYSVAIEAVAYDPRLCTRQSLHKTVCTTDSESLVVFGDSATFKVKHSARAMAPARLREIHEAMIRSFVRP